MSGFYPVHPVALTEPPACGWLSSASTVHRLRSASEPLLVSGCVSNSRPASALELKRRLSLGPHLSTTEVATPACPFHPSRRSCPDGRAFDPRVSAAWESRRCGDHPPASSGPPGTAATSRRLLRPSRGCRTCHSHQRQIRRSGCRVRTARSARARRRSSASSKRFPASLRPTTRRRRSFRGKGLRRAYTVHQLALPSSQSACPKTATVYPADDSSPSPHRPLEAD
jgi:hypothetical protein